MKRIAVLALGLCQVALQPALGFNPQPDPPGYGMIGIVPGQTLRLNVANVPLAAPQTPPDPCRVELTFVDSAGNKLLPAVQVTLRSGKSTHIDFAAPLVPDGPVIHRFEVRPVIHILPNPSTTDTTEVPPGPCVSTIEILDNRTGRTLLTSGPQKPGTIFEFNPQPDPPGRPQVFGLTGLVPGQTARLNVVNVEGDASSTSVSRVTLEFVNAEGKIVLRNAENIKPGIATFLDFAIPVSANPPIDGTPIAQAQLRAVVTIEGVRGFPPGPCRSTFEVFNQADGHTTSLLSPQRVRVDARRDAISQAAN